jgi:hypothetical protein
MKALKIFSLAMLMVLVAVPFAGAQTITWNSSFTVVNLGTTDATVTAMFYDEAGTEYVPNPLVPGSLDNPFMLGPGGSAIVVMAFVNDTLPDGRYSVVLSADQPIVAIANLAGTQDPNVNYNGSYSGSEDIGQMTAYLPSVSNSFYDWYSHLSIQNLTSAAMDITVQFFSGTTTPIAEITGNVPAYSSWHLDMDDAGITPALPTDWNGSATVAAAGPVAVVNNDYNQGMSLGAEQTYSGAAAGAMNLYCPGLYDQFIGLWYSSMNVQNIGAADANVTIWYSDGMSDSVVIAPNAAYLGVYQSGVHDPAFSAHVEGDQPLVVVANATSGASSQTYECAAAGAGEIRTPLAMKWFVGQYNTGIQVQNIGTVATDICIEYEGGYTPECQTGVAANGVVIFNTHFNAELPDNWSGSARVYSSGEDLVGIVNQNNEAPGGAIGDFALSFLMFSVTP